MRSLYDKIINYDFEALFKKKGYKYFKNGVYNLNIIGVRCADNNVDNKFDDFIIVIYNTPVRKECRAIYNVTTQPGLTYMENPCNKDGAAILVEGQYKSAYKLGKHKGQKALIQDKTVTVYRDNNRDRIYDYTTSTKMSGKFGINIHRAGTNSKQIDNWSAGCQVFANGSQFDSFLRLCDLQVENGYGSTFTYTLINEREL